MDVEGHEAEVWVGINTGVRTQGIWEQNSQCSEKSHRPSGFRGASEEDKGSGFKSCPRHPLSATLDELTQRL